MNSRKRNFPRTLNQIKEEMTSSNMSIDEDSNPNDIPLSPQKGFPNSLLSSQNNKARKVPNSNIIHRTQKRPQMNFSLYQPKLLGKKILISAEVARKKNPYKKKWNNKFSVYF